MTRFGDTVMTELSGPAASVDYAQGAERAGFGSALSSDHDSPWPASQGDPPRTLKPSAS